jgi:hypothetical protein
VARAGTGVGASSGGVDAKARAERANGSGVS